MAVQYGKPAHVHGASHEFRVKRDARPDAPANKPDPGVSMTEAQDGAQEARRLQRQAVGFG
jgi:hypothetical protein